MGEVDFGGEVVRTILITELWHLVIVECDMTWCIVTVHGVVVKRVQVFKQIAAAVTFRVPSGEDYVVFVDRERLLYFAEALHPESCQIIGKVTGEVVALEYIRERFLIVAVDRAGVLTLCTFPEFGRWIVNAR
jgi:hypothetical protein